jgi:MFS family permease
MRVADQHGGLSNRFPTNRAQTAKVNLLILALFPILIDVGFLQVLVSAWLPTVGITPLEVGILLGVQGALLVVSAIPLGIASDIYGRKPILVAGSMAGSLGVVMYALTISFPYLLLASGIVGFAEGAVLSVWNAMLADLTDKSTRNTTFSYSYVMVNVASGIGLLLPGLFPFIGPAADMTDYALHRWFLLGLGALSFVTPAGVTALVWHMRETHNPSRKFAGFHNLATLTKLGVVGGSIGFGSGFIVPLVGTWFLLRFGVGDTCSGPVLAASNTLIGLAAFASPWMAKRFGQMGAIMVTTGSSMLFMLSMAFIPGFNVAAIFYVVRTGLFNMSGPLMDSFSMSIFPPEQRGLVSAATNTVFRLPNSISTSFGGFLLGIGLLDYPFVIASALYVVGLALFYAFFVASKKYANVMPS